MRYAIFSDVHGNLPALKAVLSEVGTVDGYICLGDVVNYGPWSNECVELLGNLPNCVILKGNHEEAFLKEPPLNWSHLILEFYQHCIKKFTNFDSIENYLPSFNIADYTCLHTILNQHIYPDTVLKLTENYFIGHSHYQFETTNNGYHLYNCGSVGQNRQDLSQAQYLLFDTLLDSVEQRSCQYDPYIVINKMKSDKFPSVCIEYYQSKIRSV